jgi:hypothetical protein
VKVEFTPEAEPEHELTEASLWYESMEPGLGIRFPTEVQRVVRRADTHLPHKKTPPFGGEKGGFA